MRAASCGAWKPIEFSPERPPTVAFDNERSEAYTVLQIEAADRLGLLYDILQVLMRFEQVRNALLEVLS